MSAPSRPPQVFVVAPGGLRDIGGIGRLVRTTVRHWHATGLQPTLRVIDPYGPALSPLTPFYFLRALGQIGWNAWQGRIALVHVHMAKRGSAVRKGIIIRCAARLGIPVLLHSHGSRLDEFHAHSAAWGRWVRRTFETADRIIVPGRYWRSVLVDTVGIDAAAVRVVANAAVGPPQLAPRPQRSPCELLFLGNLSARKGLPELLQALAHRDVALLPWRLRVAGPGDARTFVARAAALGIADRVDFLGPVPEAGVHALLARAEVFVLPSHNEGLSIAMLEAMAHGCAVVATPAGATLDAVTDGESALLVPIGDPERLAAALRRVIAEPTLRAALQAGARQRWRDGFAIEGHCRRLAELYRELCPAGVVEAPSRPAPPGRGSIFRHDRNRFRPTVVGEMRRGVLTGWLWTKPPAPLDFPRSAWDLFLANPAADISAAVRQHVGDITRVIDAGCGAGQAFPYLRDAVGVGIDQAPQTLALARGLLRGRCPEATIALLCAFVEALPLRTRCADLVICQLVLPYTDNRRALAEMARVLRPGGGLILTVHRPGYYLRKLAAGLRARDTRSVIYALRVLATGLCFHLSGAQRPILRMRETYIAVARLRRLAGSVGLDLVEELAGGSAVAPRLLFQRRD